MNISLPTTLREALEKKLERHSYGTASEYVRNLIRKDLQREAITEVDELLLEGRNSGPVTPMITRDWQELRTLAGHRPSAPPSAKKTRSTPHR